jgi:hypothetical protein
MGEIAFSQLTLTFTAISLVVLVTVEPWQSNCSEIVIKFPLELALTVYRPNIAIFKSTTFTQQLHHG